MLHGPSKTLFKTMLMTTGITAMKAEPFSIILHGKEVSVSISEAARNRLREVSAPLLFDIELYFSCLIKKVCHFSEMENDENVSRVIEGLYLRFRATMTSQCSIGDFDRKRAADFPIVRQAPYIPNWVTLDFAGNQWQGDFGYASAA